MRHGRNAAIIITSLLVIAVAAVAVILLSARAGESGFSTKDALTAQEYTLAVNKEITLVLNLAESHMANGLKVIKGEYPAADEEANASHSIELVSEAIASVDALQPANGYETDHEDVLRKMGNLLGSLETYLGYLENGYIDDIGAVVEILEGDFIALKSSFNNPWN
jgi:hypothetical protein